MDEYSALCWIGSQDKNGRLDEAAIDILIILKSEL